MVIINSGSRIGGSEPPYGWTNTRERASEYADAWAQRMANDGFRDIIMTNPFSDENGGRWTFLFQHAITGVTVELEHHGIDDVDAYMRQHTFAPRVYWNGSSSAEPAIDDFAAKGFSPVITYRKDA